MRTNFGLLCLLSGCLVSGAAAQTPSKSSGSKSSSSDPAALKCKTHVETGSLAHMIKECHTVAEWDAMAKRGRSDADEYQRTINSARTN